ncbi:CmcJ/NvfI family oxidoreductase [Emcibacter sp.]|uniref:CmcJ/NvfI family oxidoreductase n=1 Tax=Emcibacter sp. TaxID=1979954 RepID=UPI002AA792ED|nr:CmcJ/NvfI family oxidoreductase [Emcibacter sp.]
MSDAQSSIDTTIKYLIPTSRINRRFWAPGEEYNTGEYEPYPVKIHNAREASEPFTIDKHGFAIRKQVTSVTDFLDDEAIKTVYAGEVEEITKEWTGADLVLPMGGQVRSSGLTGQKVQPPAGEAHVDFTPRTAETVAKKIYEKAVPDGPGYDRFIMFSLWRALSPAPQDWPLALCDFRSMDENEGTPNVKVDVDEIPKGDALFAPIPGEEDMVSASIFYHNPAHQWWYFPDMTRDEVIFIKFYDSDHSRAWRAAHTAFEDTSRSDAIERESIEFRAIAYFSAE